MTSRLVFIALAVAGGGALLTAACTSTSLRPEIEGATTRPAAAPFAAVFPERGGRRVIVLVVASVNPKLTPDYFEHPSIRALTLGFARYLPRRVSVEAASGVEPLLRRVSMCELQDFRGPCDEHVYAASLAKRKSAALEARVPGSAFGPFLETRVSSSGRAGDVVLAVLAPDAFARETSALTTKLGEPRYFSP